MLKESLEDLEHSRKEITELRSGFIGFEASFKETANNMSKIMMDRICDMEKNFH